MKYVYRDTMVMQQRTQERKWVPTSAVSGMGIVAVYMYCVPLGFHDSGTEYAASTVMVIRLLSFRESSFSKGSFTDTTTSTSAWIRWKDQNAKVI